MKALDIGDLTVTYGKAVAVSGISLDAIPGSITALVGPNGAGKSSLVMAVYGSVPSRGSITLGETRLDSMSAVDRIRAGVAVVPEGRQVFPRLTVRDNLQLFADMLKLPAEAVEQGLDRFPNLRRRERQMAGVLSGGEQQMLAVSRALLGSPRVLLLDELANGLAPVIVEKLGEVAYELAGSGIAVVVAAPELGLLKSYVGRGYVIVRGRVVAHAEEGGDELEDHYRGALGLTRTGRGREVGD